LILQLQVQQQSTDTDGSCERVEHRVADS